MKPKIKFNNGNGAVICIVCNHIIHNGIEPDALLCLKCQEKLIKFYYEKGRKNLQVQPMQKPQEMQI